MIGTIAARRQWSQPSAARVAKTREALAAMAWAQFSSALDAAFRREGFSVRAGAGAPVDFELERAGRRTLVCARKWKSARTGLEALRALQAARDASDATDAIYVCVGELSENALPYAKQHRIEVWRAEELTRRLGRSPSRRAVNEKCSGRERLAQQLGHHLVDADRTLDRLRAHLLGERPVDLDREGDQALRLLEAAALAAAHLGRAGLAAEARRRALALALDARGVQPFHVGLLHRVRASNRRGGRE
ncbi:MAG: restriction endonuclease [Burkholderiaceae bacterium]